MTIQTFEPAVRRERARGRSAPFDVSAAELARRIRIPRQLPFTYKGERLPCLSATSIAKYLDCPDEWRRHYLLGERSAATGSMFLGSRLDHVETAYFRSLVYGGGPLSAQQLRECLEADWRRALAEEQERYGGVRWQEGTDERSMLNVAVSAIDVFLKQLAQRAGTPLSVQRHFEFHIADGLQWTVSGDADLDTTREIREFIAVDGEVIGTLELLDPRPTVSVKWRYAPEDLRPALEKRDPAHSDAQAAVYQKPVEVPVARVEGDPLDREVLSVDDYKAKKKPIYPAQADEEIQPSIYCLDRHLAGVDLYGFRYMQLLLPARRQRRRVTHKVTPTRRSAAQLESFLVVIAQVAAQIVWAAENPGPDRPWGFAPPGHWKCKPDSTGTDGMYCIYWSTCPRGIGIGSAA